ncbi:MAG: hypothetical protein ABL999_08890 [Pyrinomonadaceae bacterium]
MRTVLVTQEIHNGRNYRAIAEGKESTGQTVGSALDSLTSQLDEPERDTLYIIQRYSPDEFFSAEQQKRLRYLMDKLHEMEAGTYELSIDERIELESLVNAELDGMARRAAKLAELAG